MNLAGGSFYAGDNTLVVPEKKISAEQQGRGNVGHTLLNAPDLFHLIAFRAEGDNVFEFGDETAGANDKISRNNRGADGAFG